MTTLNKKNKKKEKIEDTLKKNTEMQKKKEGPNKGTTSINATKRVTQ